MAVMIEPAIVVAGQACADELGLWVLHVARTHPRLADVLGWARMQAQLGRGGKRGKAWSRFASWLESLDSRRYPDQITAALEQIDAHWRGKLSPPPSGLGHLARQRNAKPLPACSSCTGTEAA
jgi:hypothetical protein